MENDNIQAELKRYRFLFSLLLERGVIHQYANGTWVLRGIYGVDDSGLRGAGVTPEQAIDNAIMAANAMPKRPNTLQSLLDTVPHSNVPYIRPSRDTLG